MRRLILAILITTTLLQTATVMLGCKARDRAAIGNAAAAGAAAGAPLGPVGSAAGALVFAGLAALGVRHKERGALKRERDELRAKVAELSALLANAKPKARAA